MQGLLNSTSCVPQQSFFNSMYIGTNRLFVSSMALLIQSGLSTYETEFVFRDTNWVSKGPFKRYSKFKGN